MKRIACAFCPTLVDVPACALEDGDQGEHVWGAWVERCIRDAGLAPHRYRFHTMEGERLVVKRKRTMGYQQPVVCQACNNNWMSELENHASQILRPFITHAGPVNIASEDQERLALWAVKCAVVLDHSHLIAGTRRTIFYPPHERFAMRQRWEVPRNVLINMFHNASNSFSFARATYSGASPNTRDQDLKNIETYAATYAVGRVGFQIIKFKFQNLRRGRGKSPMVTAPVGWNDYIEPLWPLPGTAVTWPPKYALSFDGMWRFAHQWVDHTPEMPKPVVDRP